MQKKCKYCGAEFVPRVRNSMEYCSIECRNKASGRVRYQSGKTGICRVCGREFVKRYGNERLCCDECRDKAFRQSNHKSFMKRYVPNPRESHSRCICCGAETNGKMYCSKECEEKEKWKRIKAKEFGSWELYQEHLKEQQEEKKRIREEERRKEREQRRKTGTCIVCGKTFSTFNQKQKTCSKECGKKLSYARKQHRIPKEQIIDKDITLEALYKRDSGVCYLCGGVCDWEDRNKETGVCGSTYPSIDHVIPVSKGGLHAWENVRLAHFACNTAKSDLVIDNANENKRSKHAKPVAQMTKNGCTIAVYPSTADAGKSTGFRANGIQKCACGASKQFRGYLWKYTG